MELRRSIWTLAGMAIVACTYNEYNTYNEVSGSPDAGSPVGRAGAGQSGAGGGVSSAAGTGGAAGAAGAAGANGEDQGEDCTGCMRLTASANTPRNVRLEFDGDQNLSVSLMTWRMRVRDFTGNVNISFYAESGNDLEDSLVLSSVTLTSSSDWQEVGADLSSLPGFSPAVFIDAGGVGGNGFDPGFPFDKTEVQRVGVTVVADVPSGVFTPFTIEVDSITFSGHPELGVTFTSNDGGLQLVAIDGAQIAGATLEQVDD